ncbi:helix-turn-helix domain-containing protein (plasmid) [Neobacillus sp. SCS-31]|uniref:helix-turn-helix domain-containing protein n=1 Tax=Neobacillus oceani TaxID=3115292 RepID=UPI003905891B
MRTEGAYVYQCDACELNFAVVSRFAAKNDYSKTRKCPKCSKKAKLHGEGHIVYDVAEEKVEEPDYTFLPNDTHQYPIVMSAVHMAEILGISRRVAYEIMERKDFPLIRYGRSKRVKRDKFFEWLELSNRTKRD